MKLSTFFLVCFVSTLVVANVGFIGLRGINTHNASAATITATGASTIIVVEVIDQNGYWYNGVQVKIWQQPGSLQYEGTVQNGFYSSGDLANDTSYTVVVSSGYKTENQTVYLGTENLYLNFSLTRPPQPVLSISGVSFSPSVISPGSTFVADMTVHSSSSSAAYNTLIAFNASTPPGIGISGSGSTVPLGQIGGYTYQSFNVTFVAQASASVANYQIPYAITFSNFTGIPQTTTGSLTVPVTGVPSRPNLVIAGVAFNPPIVAPGTDFDVNININNTGTQTAYGSTITISSTSTAISLIGSTGQTSLGVLQPGQNTSIIYHMISAASAQTGAIAVSFATSFENNRGTLFNSNGTFNVGLTSTPDLQVGGLVLSTSPLTPGLSTVLGLNVNNVGGDSAYGVALTLIGNQFLSGNSSNYLGIISGGSSAKASFYITVANNTQPGAYNLGVSLNYKDVNGRVYDFLSNFSVAVSPTPPPSVALTNTALNPPIVSPGTSGSITLFFKNSGSTAADDVIIQVTGANDLVSSKYFGLGTIGPGSQVTQVIGLNVPLHLSPGNYSIYFNATFTDSSGKSYHSSVPMEITVYGGGANPFSVENIAIVGGLVVVSLIGAGFLRRAKWI
ncbi:MAG: hypothetical protein ACREBS_03325 [Nitrososphaerales archaeon]